MYLSKLQLETLFSLASLLQVSDKQDLLIEPHNEVLDCVIFFPFDPRKRAAYLWDMAGQCWKPA